MPTPLPERTRTYQCHHLDSTRWDDLVPRPDDIVITTSLKAGTTWTQRIVSHLCRARHPRRVHVDVEPHPSLHADGARDAQWRRKPASLKADLEGQMRRIARFLEIDVPESKWPQLVDAATFASMKRGVHILGPEMGMIFEGGADGFLFKGTNGRWRDVLTDEDLELYEAAASRALTPELKRWLELGAASGVEL